MKKTSASNTVTRDYTEKNHYFAAANTINGFVSYFDELFCRDKVKRLYILKGGPGCGKSTLMKHYGKCAEKKGYSPVYYHCSSDPRSLDGVYIEETETAIVDGTAPHVVDPKYPGVKDFYVDLSCAWNRALLSQKGDRVIELVKQKQKSYEIAYSFLNASGKVNREMKNLAEAFVKKENINHFVSRFMARNVKNKNKSSGNIMEVITSAVSADGLIRLFTLENKAQLIYLVKPAKSAEGYLFDALVKEIKKSGVNAYLAISPEDPRNCLGVYFPDDDVSVSLYDEKAETAYRGMGKIVKVVNAERFVDTDGYKECRHKYRFAEKCYQTLLNAALDELSNAGKLHSQIEAIYIPVTDYKKVEEIEKSITL